MGLGVSDLEKRVEYCNLGNEAIYAMDVLVDSMKTHDIEECLFYVYSFPHRQ